MRFGPKNNNWKGGRVIASNGYVLVRVSPDHHLADIRGYAYEHRLVAEQKVGRMLKPGEQIHHINGIKTDNRPENITVAANQAEHRSLHRKRRDLRKVGEPNRLVECQCGCGKRIRAYDAYNRPRKFISGHNHPDRSKQSVLILACAGGMRLDEIAAAIGRPLGPVKTMTSKLVAEGKLKRLKRGVYAINN